MTLIQNVMNVSVGRPVYDLNADCCLNAGQNRQLLADNLWANGEKSQQAIPDATIGRMNGPQSTLLRRWKWNMAPCMIIFLYRNKWFSSSLR